MRLILLILVCLVSVRLIGQSETVFSESIPYNVIDKPKTVVQLDGWVIPYYYKAEVGYNYGVWFLPYSNLSESVLKQLDKKSVLLNKKKRFRQGYAVKDLELFEKIFGVGWEVYHSGGSYYCHLEKEICQDLYHNKNSEGDISYLIAEMTQFPSLDNSVGDTIIVYKLIRVSGIMNLYPFDKEYQYAYYSTYYQRSDYDQNEETAFLYRSGDSVCCRLDTRLKSYVFGVFIYVEFLESWRKKSSKKTSKIREYLNTTEE